MRELFKAQEALEEVVESKDEIGKLHRNLEELARENNAILRPTELRFWRQCSWNVIQHAEFRRVNQANPKEATHPINREKLTFLDHYQYLGQVLYIKTFAKLPKSALFNFIF